MRADEGIIVVARHHVVRARRSRQRSRHPATWCAKPRHAVGLETISLLVPRTSISGCAHGERAASDRRPVDLGPCPTRPADFTKLAGSQCQYQRPSALLAAGSARKPVEPFRAVAGGGDSRRSRPPPPPASRSHRLVPRMKPTTCSPPRCSIQGTISTSTTAAAGACRRLARPPATRRAHRARRRSPPAADRTPRSPCADRPRSDRACTGPPATSRYRRGRVGRARRHGSRPRQSSAARSSRRPGSDHRREAGAPALRPSGRRCPPSGRARPRCDTP